MTTTVDHPAPKKSWWRENALAIWLAVLATLIMSLFLLPDVIYFVHPGEQVVKWSRFFGGTVTDHTYGEGAHVMFPWDKIYVYDIRLQQTTADLEVLSSDGLEMTIEVTTRFRLLPGSLPTLHQHVGPDYVNKLIIPEVGAHFRSVMARYEPEQLYTTSREAIVDEILAQMRLENKVAPYPGAAFQDVIYVEDVLVRDVDLPQIVKQSIENKLAQRHLMLEYRLPPAA